MNDQKTRRQELHEAISAEHPFTGEDEPEGGVVVGWLLVAEWQGTDGERWLTKVSSDATGDRSLPAWHERGFGREVASDWWPPDGDEPE